MPHETTQQGASGFDANPPSEKAFPNNLRTGLDNPPEGSDNEEYSDQRTGVIDALEAKINAQREAEMAGLIEEPTPLEEEELDQEQEVAEEEAPEVTQEEEATSLPEEYADDPLAEFIVMDEENDTPMFVAKVNGKETYIPLDRARQQLQKHEAAEVRLQQATERQKVLDEREAQILASEQALKAKLSAPAEEKPTIPAKVADVSDQDLENEAQGIVSSLFSGTEADAVEHLARVFKSMKGSQAVQQTQLDEDQIARRAAHIARQQDAADAAQKDVEEGLAKFNEDYPDIAADEALFNYADGMTDVIKSEWMNEGRTFKTSELMAEAGKRTAAWVQSMKAPAPKVDPNPGKTDRHERKRKLRPMPKSHSQRMAQEEEVPDQTPADAVAEMRRARGQA